MDLRRLKLSSICHRSRYISRTLSVLACSTLRVVNTSTYWAQSRVSGPTGLPRCCLSFRRKSARRMASLLLRIAVSRPGIFRSPTWISVGHSAISPVLPTALSSADNLKRLPSLLYKGKACGWGRTQTSACCSTMARIPGGLLYPASASTRSFFEKTNCPNRSATPAPAVDVRTKPARLVPLRRIRRQRGVDLAHSFGVWFADVLHTELRLSQVHADVRAVAILRQTSHPATDESAVQRLNFASVPRSSIAGALQDKPLHAQGLVHGDAQRRSAEYAVRQAQPHRTPSAA